MNSKFLGFLKFLIVIAAIVNLLILFVFDGRLPSQLRLPFSLPNVRKEAAETEEEPAEEETTVEEQAPEEPETENIVFEEEETEPEEAVEEETVQRCTIISADGSNIRSGPGLDYEVVATYAYDTILVVTGEPENGWYPIQAEDGTRGYIFESQISMLEEGTQNEGDVQTQDQTQEQPMY